MSLVLLFQNRSFFGYSQFMDAIIFFLSRPRWIDPWHDKIILNFLHRSLIELYVIILRLLSIINKLLIILIININNNIIINNSKAHLWELKSKFQFSSCHGISVASSHSFILDGIPQVVSIDFDRTRSTSTGTQRHGGTSRSVWPSYY